MRENVDFSGVSLSKHTLAHKGGQVAYYTHPGEGLPFLLVHGMGSAASNFTPIVPELVKSGRPIVLVDLPGHGQSSPNLGHQGIDDLVEATHKVMRKERITRAHLVGHSLGGGVCMLLTQMNPHCYASLTLVASGGLGENVSWLLRAGSLPLARVGFRLAVNPATAAIARGVHVALDRAGAHPYEFGDSVVDLLGRLSDGEHASAFMETLEDSVSLSGQKRTALEQLGDLDGDRVSFIWCAIDPVIPVEQAYAAHAACPGSSLTVFSGRSHEPHQADPARFASLVLEHAVTAEQRHPHIHGTAAPCHEGCRTPHRVTTRTRKALKVPAVLSPAPRQA